MRLIQITDCHVTAGEGEKFLGVDPLATLGCVVGHARDLGWPPDAVLATGDLVADGSAEAYRRLRPALAGLEAPVFVLPGNHDDVGVLDRSLVGGTIRSETLWSAGGWRILFLDSTIPGQSHGYLGPERLGALDRALAQQTTKPVLVCLHHNPFRIGSGADYCPLADGADLFGVADHHPHVRGLAWGHAHCAFDATRRGVRLMGTPSTAAQFATESGALATIEDCPGYRTITLGADWQITTEVHWVRV